MVGARFVSALLFEKRHRLGTFGFGSRTNRFELVRQFEPQRQGSRNSSSRLLLRLTRSHSALEEELSLVLVQQKTHFLSKIFVRGQLRVGVDDRLGRSFGVAEECDVALVAERRQP